MYDAVTGVATNAQDVRAAQDQCINIAAVPWKEWVGGRAAQTLPEKATHMAAIPMVLYSLHTRGRIENAPIDVSIDLTKHRKVVKASEDLPAGALALPPCVPKSSSVFDTSTHPNRVPIIVTEKSAVADGKPQSRLPTKGNLEPKQTMYYVHPESKTPEESKAQLDAAVQPGACAWEFKGEDTMHPFLGC